MFQIKDTIVSSDIVEEHFLCDIEKCLGQCCVEGDAGAPLEEEEERILKENLSKLMPYLTPLAREEIKKHGISYIDEEGDRVTSIIGGKDCVFAFYEEGDRVCRCAIEKAWGEGIFPFKKPISCHLYPIRLEKYKHFTAVNYHQWKVCEMARLLGRTKGLPLYKFLKEPLIRRFGEEWYESLCAVAEEVARTAPIP